MYKIPSNTTPASAFLSNFSRLDQQIRRRMFTYLQDDLHSATEFAISSPRYEHEIGMLVFRVYHTTSVR